MMIINNRFLSLYNGQSLMVCPCAFISWELMSYLHERNEAQGRNEMKDEDDQILNSQDATAQGIINDGDHYFPDPCELTFANTLLLSNAAISLGITFTSLEISSLFYISLSFTLCSLFISKAWTLLISKSYTRSDSEEVVTPLMLDGTYLSRNIATLGPYSLPATV